MKKRNSSVFGLIAFVFGALIIVLAYILLMQMFSFNPVAYTFSFVSILLTYILFFLPMFFGPFTGDVAGTVLGGTFYYRGLTIYALLSAVNIALVFVFMPLAVSIIIQCIALFVLLLWAFLGQVTKEHIDDSLRNEDVKKSVVTELRNRAAKLTAMTSSLESENKIRANARKIEENMRYLSPSDNPEAREIELQMLAKLNAILNDPLLTSSAGAENASLSGKFNDFDVLYKERKSIL